MLNMNLLVVILLVVIQQARQSDYNMVDDSNKNCGNKLFIKEVELDEVDPNNIHPVQNIFRQNKRNQARNRGDQAVLVPVLLLSGSAFKDINGGNFNFHDIRDFKITQNRKLKHNFKARDDKYNGKILLFRKNQTHLSFLKPAHQEKSYNGNKLLLLNDLFDK